MFRNIFILISIAYITLTFIMPIGCKRDYDHVDVKCESKIVDGQDEKDFSDMRTYLFAIGNGSLYYKDTSNGIYFRYVNINTFRGMHTRFEVGKHLNMFDVYEVEYEAYLMDGSKTTKETLFDRGRKKIQPYLGIYNRILPGFGIALSKLYLGVPGEKSTIDFYLTSNAAFSVCGWPYSPFGIEVPPNAPVHFIVTVLF